MANENRTKQKIKMSPAFAGAARIMIFALLFAELLVFAIYSQLEPENLARRLSLSAIITCVVSFPIGFYIQRQKQQLIALSKKLAITASTDQLSGLLNRASYLHSVEEKLTTPKSGPTAGCFLFIDIDHFKKLNDRFGHAVGDSAIRKVAKIIFQHVDEDLGAGRLGGEEFGLFLPNANKKKAISVAENIRRKVRKLSFHDERGELRLSVSIGCTMHMAGQSLTQLVSAADHCMYQAKQNGRNQIVFGPELATEEQVSAPNVHQQTA